MVVEHAFGRLTRRFPLIAKPHKQALTTRAETVWACCILHNFVIDCGGEAVTCHNINPQIDDIVRETEYWIFESQQVALQGARGDHIRRGRPTQVQLQQLTGTQNIRVPP